VPVDFSLTESQQEIARLAGQLLDASPGGRPPRTPAELASPGGRPPRTPAANEGKADPWKELARAGLLALSLPPELGGDGLGVLDTAVLLTEIGRRAAPVPALATLMTGVLPVVRWGDDGTRRALLPAAAAGELVLTAGLREPSEAMPLAPAVTVAADGTVSGIKVGVPYCAQAGRVLLPVSFAVPPRGDDPPGSPRAVPPRGDDPPGSPREVPSPHTPSVGVVIVDPAADGALLTRTPSVAGGPEYTLRLDQVPVEHVLGGASCLTDLYQLAVAGACSLADGAVSAALALTRDHIATRRQFGRPLAAFQAVAQQAADVYIASRTLHLATLSACWRLDAGLDAAGDLGVAGYWCAAQAPRSLRTCHHLHGGTGMDVTYPLHRFSALVSDLVRFLGGAEYQLESQACSLN
jgi:3-oxo-4-pregnene-20-carboxyl-CoA dehydrogenase alpha subunit